MALRLLCDRPLFRQLDLQSARFVVSRGVLTVNGKQLGMGEEIPRGSLTPYALACEYERPLCRIDTVAYAMTQDGLREACEAHGVKFDPQPAAEQVVTPDLDALDYAGLSRLCEIYRLDKNGNTKQLRKRLEKFLEAEALRGASGPTA